MTLNEQDTTYTPEQAQELERALEAQYRAHTRQSPPAREYAEWTQVRRVAAARRFQRANRSAVKVTEGWPRRGEVWWVETPNQRHDPDTPRVALIVSEHRWNDDVDSDILAEVVLKTGRTVGDVVPLQPGEEYPTLSLD